MGTLVLAGATSGSTTLTPVDAVTTVLTLPSSTATLATLGANTFTGNQSITGTLGVTGSVGVGTYSDFTHREINGGAQYTDAMRVVATNDGDATGIFILGKELAAGTQSGFLWFGGTNGTDQINLGGIGIAGNTTTPGAETGSVVIYAKPAAGAISTVATFASTGAVTIPGTLSSTGELSVSKSAAAEIFYLDNANASPYIARWRMTGTAPNNTTNSFLSCLDNAATCFTIWSNGTTSGRSDSRLKKNIAPVNNQLEDVMAMEVVNYEWNESIGGIKEVGFIAQQVQGVKPGLVCNDENGFLHVKQTPLTPILWKAVQELAAKVAALENK